MRKERPDSIRKEKGEVFVNCRLENLPGTQNLNHGDRFTCTISSDLAKTTSGYLVLNCSKNGAIALHGPHPDRNVSNETKR